MPKLSLSRRTLLVGGVILLVCLGAGAWFIYRIYEIDQRTLDGPILKTLANIASITSYTQNVETQTEFPERILKIKGIYGVDTPNQHYSAYSTTTLLILGDPIDHSFSHINVSIGDDVYTKVETNDKMLQKSIKNGPQWLHFKSDSIPELYAGIVVPGPIQDNLQILSDNGAYLSLIGKHGLVHWENESLLEYTFKVSDKIPPEGPIKALVARVGSDGRVNVWIDPVSFEPRYLLFENKPYISTTSIENINATLPISAPAGA